MNDFQLESILGTSRFLGSSSSGSLLAFGAACLGMNSLSKILQNGRGNQPEVLLVELEGDWPDIPLESVYGHAGTKPLAGLSLLVALWVVETFVQQQ